MIKNLPVAAKTNIKNWSFSDLVLKDVPVSTLCEADIQPSENQIILIDGTIVHNTVPSDLIIESNHLNNVVLTTNSLIESNNDKRNSSLKITVPKNTIIKSQISVVVVAKERSLIHGVKVILEMGSQISLVETYLGIGNFNSNIVSRYSVGANANLQLNTISKMHSGCVVYHHKRNEIDADGKFDVTNFVINDTDMVFEDFTYLNGRGAEANAKTVSVASNSQLQNLTVHIENAADYTVGNIVNYGIVKDNAHLAFNGIGKIQKEAKSSDNQQETRILNLSKTAEAVANPFLLIDEGDITAGHAASIGQLDEEQIYYLMSRGMSKIEAGKMVSLGFLTPFVDVVSDAEMKKDLVDKIEEKLG